MTRASLHESAVIQRERYRQAASKKARGAILTEVGGVTGMHRKAVIRLLRRAPTEPGARSRAGRPWAYGAEVARGAEVQWEASGDIGAPRYL